MKVKHKKMYLTITNVQVLNIQLKFKRLFSNNQVSFLLDFKLDVNVKVCTLFETLKCFILMTELKQAHLISSSSTLQSHKCNPAVRHEHAHIDKFRIMPEIQSFFMRVWWRHEHIHGKGDEMVVVCIVLQEFKYKKKNLNPVN